MKKYMVCFILIFLFCSVSAQNSKPTIYSIIPLPQHINEVAGKPFVFSSTTKISFPKNDKNLEQIAVFLSEYIQIATGIKVQITDSPSSKNTIELQSNFKNKNGEAYKFTVDNNKISINGASSGGTFYGVQLLRKVLMISNEKFQIKLPQVEIVDYPRFGYRGMMLDVARHFAPIDFVKKFIDILALHNINTFHWHLTDDQGWRIEIKKYPKLTEIGSKRSETIIGKSKNEYDGKPHGGFYTQNEIKEIVEYAQKRYINVIPEIDLPGHMMAALASYPELGCAGKDYEVRKKWGVSDDVLCVGNENTFKFLESVFEELVPLFPSKYFHIGGDECPKKSWKNCPKCQSKILELGLKRDGKHTAEEKLQSYCIGRVEKFLNSKGKKIIGWDEILEGGIAPNATIMSWRSFQGGIEAAKQGHDAIMTPSSHVYFDHYQGKDTNLEPLAIGGYTSLERVYSFEPIPEVLNSEERKHIIGAQANVWREYMPTTDYVEYMILPRLAALSEVLWTEPEKKNYPIFLNRLANFLPVYDELKFNYAKNILEVSSHYTIDTENSRLILDLKTSSKNPIYYTLDGSVPTINSEKYKENISIKKSVTVKAAVISEKQKNKVFEQSFEFNKATLKPVVLKNQPVERYRFNGANTLVDGRIGTMVFSTGDWIGLFNENFEAVVDLKSIQEVTKVSVNTFISPNDWIFGPKQFIIFLSDDGLNFTQVYNKDIEMAMQGDNAKILNLKANFVSQNARYIKIVAPINEKIPQWHYAAGKPTFLFVDEIVVN
ncbi:MAG: family 20 glycosylhydrolase [Flavobacterium sp.]|nr:family 20 glycosylhydrolase [Flavobacterium sp.]